MMLQQDRKCSHWDETIGECEEFKKRQTQPKKKDCVYGFLPCVDGVGSLPKFLNFRCKFFDLSHKFVVDHIRAYIAEKKGFSKIEQVLLHNISGGFDLWFIVSKKNIGVELHISELVCDLMGQHDLVIDSLVQRIEDTDIDELKADGWVVIYERSEQSD